MRLTKHAHSCVEIDHGDGHLLIDPGSLTANAATLVARTAVVLITHQHADHLDADAVAAALATRRDLRVYGPAAAVEPWLARYADRVKAVGPGDALLIEGIEVTVHGGAHAVVHADLPRVANVGYLIEGTVFHPGDSYDVPGALVDVLLLPVSGPWMKLAEAVEFARAVSPERIVAIHELAASPFGLQLLAAHFAPGRLVETVLEVLELGEAVEV